MNGTDYHKDFSRITNTMLGDYLESPALYKGRYITKDLHRPDSTSSQRIGIAAHALLLRPDDWEDEIAVAPKCDRRTNAGKALYAEFVLSSSGKLVVSNDEMEVASRCAAAVIDDPIASPLVDAEGVCEAAIEWECPITRLPLKAKPDKYNHSPFLGSEMIDLKTCQDPSPGEFGAHAKRYHIGRQMAHYRQGLITNGNPVDSVKIIAVGVAEPNDVFVYHVQADTLASGEAEQQYLLTQIRDSVKTGVWRHEAQKSITPLLYPHWGRKGQ